MPDRELVGPDGLGFNPRPSGSLKLPGLTSAVSIPNRNPFLADPGIRPSFTAAGAPGFPRESSSAMMARPLMGECSRIPGKGMINGRRHHSDEPNEDIDAGVQIDLRDI